MRALRNSRSDMAHDAVEYARQRILMPYNANHKKRVADRRKI